MNDMRFTCPRCGGSLIYDAATGLLWCPEAECGFAAPREALSEPTRIPGSPRRSGASSLVPDAHVVMEDNWTREPRSRRRTIFFGVVVLVTAAAVLATSLSPLLWPQRPVLSVTPGEIVFDDHAGMGVMPRALAIQNHGKGRLDWQISTEAPWLAIDPQSGSIESDLQILTVKADTSTLPEGTHSTTFTVTAVGARNSPQVIAVQVEIVSPPEARSIRELLGDAVEVYYGTQPPYVTGPTGVPIRLEQASDVKDVSWLELVDFLRADATDQSPYVQDLYMCGTFAETLYNNAAAAGIRAAWVAVDIRGRTIGHALNAFSTTDRGLVFVDCTGGDAAVAVAPGYAASSCDHDRVSYVRPGMAYGLISLEHADSPAYEFYETYSAAWDSYLADLEEFNRLAREYNAFIEGRTLIAGSADAREAQRLHRDLQSRRVSLEMQREVIGDCRWVSIGIVDSVRIYW